MHCIVCKEPLDWHATGISVRALVVVQSPKSGRPIPWEDRFPDGAEEKIVCGTCIPHELRVLLDWDQPGYDAPPLTKL